MESILDNGHANAFEHAPLRRVGFDGEIVDEVAWLALARRVEANFRGGLRMHHNVLGAAVELALVWGADLIHKNTTIQSSGVGARG